MSKTPKHTSHRWDGDDDLPVDPPPVVEKTGTEARDFVPPPMVKVKCIVHLHPWTEVRWLDLDEVVDVTEATANLLLEKGFVELVTDPPARDAK